MKRVLFLTITLSLCIWSSALQGQTRNFTKVWDGGLGGVGTDPPNLVRAWAAIGNNIDIDKDGNNEFISYDATNKRIFVWESQGTGLNDYAVVWHKDKNDAVGQSTLNGSERSIMITDLDEDGNLELVMIWDSFDPDFIDGFNALEIYEHDPNSGDFLPDVPTLTYDPPRNNSQLIRLEFMSVATDVDGDGVVELILTHRGGTNILLSIISLPGKNFASPDWVVEYIDNTRYGMKVHSMTVGDLDGDGKQDMLVQVDGDDQPIIVYTATAANSYTSVMFDALVYHADYRGSAAKLVMADINGNGNKEVYLGARGGKIWVVSGITDIATAFNAANFTLIADLTPEDISKPELRGGEFGDADNNGKSSFYVAARDPLEAIYEFEWLGGVGGDVTDSDNYQMFKLYNDDNDDGITVGFVALAIGDLDGDGLDHQDIVFVTGNGNEGGKPGIYIIEHDATPPPAPDIAVSPDTIDFGTVFIGFPDTLSVNVTNTGFATLQITGISAAGAGFTANTSVFALEPGETQLIAVALEATSVQAYTGSLTITSNDPDNPTVTVALKGEGLFPPEIGVAPTTLSAALFTGGLDTQVVQISNTGDSDLMYSITPEYEGAQAVSIEFLGNLDYPQDVSDVWGYSAPDGTELAIMGTYSGTAFIDVSTNPTEPAEVAFITGPNSSWRDIKTYDHYAYIVTEGGGGMQIVDLADPQNPVLVATYSESFYFAHNLFIDQAGFAYIVGSDAANGGLHILDLTDPVAPVVAGNWSDRYVHDVYVRNDTAYAASVYNGTLDIIDVTMKSNPTLIAFTYTSGFFTHNVWLTDDGDYALTTDEVYGGYIDIYDIRDLTNINRVGQYRLDPTHIPHNVFVKGNLAYLSAYVDGVVVLDISDPTNPVLVGQYDTYDGLETGFAGAWGVYPFGGQNLIYVSDMQSGLYVLEARGWLGTAPGTGTVAAGSSADVSVTFDATSLSGGSYTANMVIASNDPVDPEIMVAVSLAVTGASDIYTAIDTIDFGQIFVNYADSVELLVENKGTEDLLITPIVADPVEYTISPTFAGINPDDSQVFLVKFAPLAVNDYPGTITFTTTDPDEGTYVIVLQGQGVDPPIISVTPDSLSDSLFTGGTSVQYLTIDNSTGGSDLIFDITVQLPADSLPGGPVELTSRDSESYPRKSGADHELPSGQGAIFQFFEQQLAAMSPGIVVFYDDMESGINEWTTEVYNIDDLWHQTNISYNSPVTSWWVGDDSLGNYATGNTIQTAAVSPPIRLNSLSAPITLEFFEYYETESGWDYCMVDVSVDGGASWTPLRGGWGEAPSGSSAGWIMSVLDLSPYAGETIQIRYYFDTSDALSNDYPGWFFDDVLVTATGVPWLAVSPETGTVVPGSSVDIQVTFDAAGLAGGDYQAGIVVTSNDPITPESRIAVHLDVTGASDIAVSADTLDFGQAFVGYTDTLELVVENSGTDDLVITGVVAAPGQYTVIPSSASIIPGEDQIFLVRLLPTEVGDYPGTVTFTSNDPDEGTLVIILQGQAVLPPIIALTPDSLSADLLSGDSSVQYLTIDNSTGGSDLIFEISIENVEAAATSMNVRYRDFGQELNNDLQLKQKENVTQSKSILFPASGLKTPKKWEDYRQVSQNNRTILKLHPNGNIPDITQQTLPVVIEDPEGDGGVVDITVLRGASISEVLEIEMEFATAIDQFDFGGMLLLDTDQDSTTGIPSFGYPEQDIGGEYEIQFFSLGSGVVDLYDVITFEYIGSYPVVIETYTLRFSIPLAHIGNDDGDMDVTGVVGDSNAPTDLFPDQGHGTIGGVSWLSTVPTAGTVLAGSSLDIAVTFDAEGLFGGDYRANIVVASNDPATPRHSLPAQLAVTGVPHIYIEADFVDFGGSFVGYLDSVFLRIDNVGTDVLEITNVLSGNEQLSAIPTSLSIPPASNDLIRLYLLATTEGIFSSTITLVTNDPDSAEVSRPVYSVIAIAPDISLTPNEVLLTARPDSVATAQLTLFNSGGSDLSYTLSVGYPESGAGVGNLAVLGQGGPDAFGYRWKDSNEPGGPAFEWIDNTGALLLILGDDDFEVGIPLGFDFSYYGATFSQINIMSNGWVSFTSYDNWLPWVVPDTTGYYSGAIAPFAGDLFPLISQVDQVWYKTEGTAPNRVFVVGYNKVPWCCGDEPPYMTFEVVFYESGNKIRFQYLDLQGQTPWAIGIASPDNSTGLGNGGSDITYIDPAIVGDNYALEFATRTDWLLVEPVAGSVAAGDSVNFAITTDISELELGGYSAQILVTSNDPDEGLVVVPVSLSVTLGVEAGQALPQSFALHQNYPNPFNPRATIRYDLPIRSEVHLVVYDILGRAVAELIDQVMEPGYHSVTWNASDNSGRKLASGIYIAQLVTPEFTKSIKMVLLK